MDEYLKFISGLVFEYGYYFLFFGIMIENIFLIGLIFPGLFILIISGYYAGSGDFSLFYCLVIGYLGTITGDNISYFIGKKGFISIKKIKSFSNKYQFIKHKIFNEEQTFYFLLFYHFPVYSRMVVPLLLGMFNYDFKKWSKINSIGALIFSSAFILIGYFINKSSKLLNDAIDISNYIQWLFFVLFLYFIFYGLFTLRNIIKNLKDK